MTRAVILWAALTLAAAILLGIAVSRRLGRVRRSTTVWLSDDAYRADYTPPDVGHGHVRPVRGEGQTGGIGHG